MPSPIKRFSAANWHPEEALLQPGPCLGVGRSLSQLMPTRPKESRTIALFIPLQLSSLVFSNNCRATFSGYKGPGGRWNKEGSGRVLDCFTHCRMPNSITVLRPGEERADRFAVPKHDGRLRRKRRVVRCQSLLSAVARQQYALNPAASSAIGARGRNTHGGRRFEQIANRLARLERISGEVYLP